VPTKSPPSPRAIEERAGVMGESDSGMKKCALPRLGTHTAKLRKTSGSMGDGRVPTCGPRFWRDDSTAPAWIALVHQKHYHFLNCNSVIFRKKRPCRQALVRRDFPAAAPHTANPDPAPRPTTHSPGYDRHSALPIPSRRSLSHLPRPFLRLLRRPLAFLRPEPGRLLDTSRV